MFCKAGSVTTWVMLVRHQEGRLYREQFCQLAEDLHVQSEPQAWLDSLLSQPCTQAAGVPGHHQEDALSVDAVVMQLADAWHVF